jgi:hypothetical protein
VAILVFQHGKFSMDVCCKVAVWEFLNMWVASMELQFTQEGNPDCTRVLVKIVTAGAPPRRGKLSDRSIE